MKGLTAVQREIVNSLSDNCEIVWANHGSWSWWMRRDEAPIRAIQFATLDRLKADKLLVKKIPDQPPRDKGNAYILNTDHPELTKIIPG